jgi:hypothetical protein
MIASNLLWQQLGLVTGNGSIEVFVVRNTHTVAFREWQAFGGSKGETWSSYIITISTYHFQTTSIQIP